MNYYEDEELELPIATKMRFCEKEIDIEIVPLDDQDVQDMKFYAVPLTVNGLMGILYRNAIRKIKVTETLPCYLVLDFVEWQPEIFTVEMDVWDWLADCVDEARRTVPVCWQTEGF
jgi:hypothetical protein